MITRKNSGFLQTYNNVRIAEIEFFHSGDCQIQFTDGTERRLQIGCEPVYHVQFGVPVSEDGKLLYLSSWETGLTAFDTENGEKRWSYRSTRVGPVFVWQDYVIAVKYGEKLIQLNASTGSVEQERRSSTLETAFLLQNGQIYVNAIKGRDAIVTPDSLEIIRQFTKKETNPDSCLSHVVTGASLSNGMVEITGFESGRNRNPTDTESISFRRILKVYSN